MRSARLATLGLLAALAAGCGGTHRASTPATKHTAPVRGQGLRVGVVGPLHPHVAGAVVERGTLRGVADDTLVLVSAELPDAAATVAAAAGRHPSSHFALVGGSTKGFRRPNVAGLVIPLLPVARLAGRVAGLAATDEVATGARVAWVGPEERPLANAFAAGVHRTAADATVLEAWSSAGPAACKEAAIAAIARGAIVVAAHTGECASAAVAGAHDRNLVALRLDDFELPDVVAAQAVRDALHGVYHGGEDVVYDAAAGAIGIRRLDPRMSAAARAQARLDAQQLAGVEAPAG